MKYRFYAAALAATVVLASPAFAQTATETILASQPSGYGGTFAGTIQASDGNFYPALLGPSYIFRVTPAGVVSVLKGQIAAACGTGLSVDPIEGPDGDLYATTAAGGTNGYGVFFSYSLVTKTCTALGNVPSTSQSPSPLTIGADGNFYGVYYSGGANSGGFAYRVTPAGAYTDLYDFDAQSGNADGSNPVGAMLQGSDGNWYGQLRTGITGASQGGVFQLVPGATVPWQENIFLDFSSPTGYYPTSQPTEWTDGNIYGTLYTGAVGYGSIWESDLADNNPNSEYFAFPGPDTQAQSNLFLAGDSNFYSALGNTAGNDDGGFFVFNPGTSKFTDVFGFAPSNGDLTSPLGPVIQGTDGAFYGTASSGGANSVGGLYRIAISPAPKPVITVTATPANSSASSITIAWTVREVTSQTAEQCFAYPYVVSGGFNTATTTAGNWGGKLSSAITSFTMSGSTTVAPTAVGEYVYSVECQGKIAGLSSVITVTGLSAAPTRTVLAVSPTTPLLIGATATATATVTPASGSGMPTGSVNFMVGGTLLGARTLNSSGVATLTASTAGQAAQTYPVYAVYTGDSGDADSTSNTVNVVISKYSTSTTLTAPGTQSRSSVTVTATVKQTNGSAAGNAVTSGSVAFYGDGQYIYTAPVNSQGVATFTGSATAYPTGTYSVTAVYSGNSTENTSTAPAMNLTLD